MAKTKAAPPIVLPDDADSIVVKFYVADGAPRVVFSFPAAGVSFNRPLSDYSTLTPAQKVNLRLLLTTLRDETFALEGFV